MVCEKKLWMFRASFFDACGSGFEPQPLHLKKSYSKASLEAPRGAVRVRAQRGGVKPKKDNGKAIVNMMVVEKLTARVFQRQS